MREVILVTGASSGFGALTARALANAGHIVYASMLDVEKENASQVAEIEAYAKEHGVDLHTVELDVTSQDSADAAIALLIKEQGRIDVLIHNAGHMAFGPAEAFTPEQYAQLYDINVIGTQRVNRAALPYLRSAGRGFLIWVGSTSTRGGTPPYLAPYFAAKAAMDRVAVAYAGELIRYGIDTTIVLPGAYATGTNHFANASKPKDDKRAAAYEQGPTKGLGDKVMEGQKSVIPPNADVAEVARAIVEIVGMPQGTRPFRLYIDPTKDGAEIVGVVADRVRVEFMRRVGLEDLLPASASR